MAELYYERVTIGYVDADTQEELCKEKGIDSFPSFEVYDPKGNKTNDEDNFHDERIVASLDKFCDLCPETETMRAAREA